MKRIITRIRILHVTRGADGRATSYKGIVMRGAKMVASTGVMADGIQCLRIAEALEATYKVAQRAVAR